MSEHWVQTASGRRMDLVSPRAEDILLDDIAVGLSNLCRFTGQVRAGFYSVAQHSVHVAERVLALTGDVDLARCGLMHDAPEAYIHDLASPIKRLLPQYRGDGEPDVARRGGEVRPAEGAPAHREGSGRGAAGYREAGPSGP